MNNSKEKLLDMVRDIAISHPELRPSLEQIVLRQQKKAHSTPLFS